MTTNYFYISSKMHSDLVLDIRNSSTASISPLVINLRAAGVDSQMWAQVYTGSVGPGGGFSDMFIENKMLNGASQALLADVEGSDNASGTRVISYTKNSPTSDNQVWQMIASASHSGYFYITSNLAAVGDIANVMTVEGAYTSPGTGIVSSPKANCNSKKTAFAGGTDKKSAFAAGECDNQLWSLIPVPSKKSAFAGGSGSKKSAFAADGDAKKNAFASR